MPSRWLIAALLMTGLLAGLHFFALADFWYWRYPWFDIPMHMLGGAALGVFAVALIRSYRPLLYILFILGASVSWEVFEAVANVATPPGENYVWDTALDILDDSVGAIIVYVIARFTLWRTRP